MTVTDESLLSALSEAIDPATSPVATPDDVAGSLPIGAEAVRQRLLRFAADGDVQTRKVGRSRVFWLLEDDRADEGDRPDRGAPEFDPSADVDQLLQEATDDVVDDPIGDVATPADTPDRETFESAAEAVLDHLRDVGTDQRSGFISALHSDFSAGYPNSRTWWRRVAKPVLEAHPDVVAPPEGGSKWSLTD